MRVGVNLQALHPGQIGGLEGYVRHLIAHLPAVDGDLAFVLFCRPEAAPTLEVGPRVELVPLSDEAFSQLDRRALAAHRLDLWWCPLLVLEPADPGIPAVVTIPDLQHVHFPEFFTPEILAWRRRHYPRSAAVARRVLTLSAHAREEIARCLPVPRARIVATHLDAAIPIDPSVRPPSDPPRSPIGRFLLYPGRPWPHKNHATLLDAWRLLQDRGVDDLRLVLTGRGVESLGPLVAELGLGSSVHLLGHLPDADLSALYRTASALVFPSLFEGFGIPLVEAMRSGCPILSSRAASLPEVAGHAALYFDPEDPSAIAATVAAFLEGGPALRLDLVRAGRARARRFSWARAAELTLEAFRHASAAQPIHLTERFPLVSVVTPSFQQATFLQRTLDSVATQAYPRIEHLVFDGGSRDGSVELLERARRLYPEELDFVSAPDRGQAHAVNLGLDRARGEILGWLNSDDLYLPGALGAVVEAFEDHPEWDLLYGRAPYVDTEDRRLGWYPVRAPFDWRQLAHECFLCQPAVFFRRRALDDIRLDESLTTALDYELWIRLGSQRTIGFLDRPLAASRLYRENKTLGQRDLVFQEVVRVVSRAYGRVPLSWLLGWAQHRVDGRGDDLTRGPGLPSRRAVAVAVLLALRHTPVGRWSSLVAELRGLAARPRPRGHRARVPATWAGLEVVPSRTGFHRLWDDSGLLAEGSGPLAAYRRRAPDAGPASLWLEGEDGAPAPIASLRPVGLVSGAGEIAPDGHLALPASWRAAEVELEARGATADGARVVFRCAGHSVASWRLPASGATRRVLPLDRPWDPAPTEIEVAATGLPPGCAVRVLSIREVRA